jgi:TPR repeat protein
MKNAQIAIVSTLALVACNDKAPVDVKAAAACPNEHACFDLARERKAAGDAAGAYAAYRRGCDEFPGTPENCFSAALLANGDDSVMPAGVPPDPEAAQRYYVKACERGMGDGCANAGVHYVQASERSRGHELLVKSCTMKSGLGCYNLGVVVRDGTGVVADRTRAATLFEQACTYQYGGGCHNLGLALMKGDGVVQDQKRAVQFLDQACTLIAKHCFDVALAYERGDGVAKDLGRARQLYDKGCTAGDLMACTNLANFMADALGGPRDLAGATKLDKRACDGGVQVACDNLHLKD